MQVIAAESPQNGLDQTRFGEDRRDQARRGSELSQT